MTWTDSLRGYAAKGGFLIPLHICCFPRNTDRNTCILTSLQQTHSQSGLSWSTASVVVDASGGALKQGFFIIRASVPRFIPLKSGMPSRGKWIGCAQSISLFSSVRICVEEFVMSVCVSACKAVGSGTRMPSFFFFSFFCFLWAIFVWIEPRTLFCVVSRRPRLFHVCVCWFACRRVWVLPKLEIDGGQKCWFLV